MKGVGHAAAATWTGILFDVESIVVSDVAAVVQREEERLIFVVFYEGFWVTVANGEKGGLHSNLCGHASHEVSES